MTDFPIRELPLAERPRERLLEHGGRALSDSELLAGEAAADLDGSEQARGLGGANAVAAERVGCGTQKPGEPAALPQQILGELDG